MNVNKRQLSFRKKKKGEAFYKQCCSLCDELGVTMESGRGETGCLLNRKRVINIFCPTDHNYSHWLKKNKHPLVSLYYSRRIKFKAISHSGIVRMNCYFITPNFLFIYLKKTLLTIVIHVFLAITCLCSAFKDSLASNHYCCCGACVPCTVAFLVGTLEPALNNCKRATCPS